MVGTDAGVLQARAADAEAEVVTARLRRRFRRRAAQHHAGAYLRGLLGDVERKNGWHLAEQAGYGHPRTIQRVLDRSVWDAEAVRDDLRAFVVAHLGAPDGVLVVDETGFVKKGTKSCGVARQYSGTAGRIENCQIGVFLGYASPKGRAGIDRALDLPKEWAADPARRVEAGVPETSPFQTKPQLALEMIERALDAEGPAKWVVADEVYGSDGKLRRALEVRDQAYVLAVKSNEMPTTWPPYAPPGQIAVSAVARTLEPEAWQRLSCGDGAQGERIYDWACVPLRPALRAGWVHALLVRRHPTEPDEVAYYLVYAPLGTPLGEIVRAAGGRWAIEAVFKLAKGQAGLDDYEVRSWTGWHRHTVLALLALAILAVVAVEKRADRPTTASSRSASRSCAACCTACSPAITTRPPSCWPGRTGGDVIRRSRASATSGGGAPS
jgi:SRSO17 transposase